VYVSCSVLQCVAACCSMLRFVALCCSAMYMRGVALRCSTHFNDSAGCWEELGVCLLQCVAVCYIVLLCVAVG